MRLGALLLALLATVIPPGLVDQAYTVLTVLPSDTDSRITAQDLDHVVIYDSSAKPGNILLFLAGTNGVPPGPLHFLNRAVERGYRAVYLSYVDTPAVAQVCVGEQLREDPDCAQQFRQKRIYGDNATAFIADTPADAIVNRFTKLLQFLVANDPKGHWDRYLSGGAPIWTRVAVAGQSQGGGMAEFIAQRQLVARVIAFSGGWDHSAPDRIAQWYLDKSATPLDRWFCTYNIREDNAKVLARIYATLGVPSAQIFALSLPVRDGSTAHAEGVSNPAYEDVWDRLLGDGADVGGEAAKPSAKPSRNMERWQSGLMQRS